MAQGSKNLSSMRSRRPQGGLEGGPIPAADLQTPVGNVTLVAAGNLDDDLQSANDGENGYATGNHMYLHIAASYDETNNGGAGGNNATATFSVYGYNYAMGRWCLLRLPTQGGAGATWNTILDPVTVQLDTGDLEQFVIPIYGIDRVAFVGGSADDIADFNDATGIFQVAFSTF